MFSPLALKGARDLQAGRDQDRRWSQAVRREENLGWLSDLGSAVSWGLLEIRQTESEALSLVSHIQIGNPVLILSGNKDAHEPTSEWGECSNQGTHMTSFTDNYQSPLGQHPTSTSRTSPEALPGMEHQVTPTFSGHSSLFLLLYGQHEDVWMTAQAFSCWSYM